jgi:hypothetical protein
MSNDHNGRIYAKMQYFYRRAPMVPNTVCCMTEVRSLDDAFPSGKFDVMIGPATNNGDAEDQYREAIAAAVNDKYPGHNFRARDVLGCTI